MSIAEKQDIQTKINEAEILVKKDLIKDAIKIYAELLNVYPQYEDAYWRIVDLYIIQDEEDETEDIEHALEYLDKLYSVTEKKEKVLHKKSRILFESGMLGKAEQETSKLIAKYPHRAEYYKLYADILSRMRQFERAIRYYEKAIEKRYEPLSEIYSQLANIYYMLGDYDKAISYFEELIKLTPESPLAYYHLALAYEKKGDLTKVIECADEVLKSRKGNTEMLELKARCLIEMQKYHDAIRVLDEWRKADPENEIDTYVLEAEIYRKQKNYNKALEVYNKVLTIHMSPYILEEKAEVLSLMGRDEEALRVLEDAFNYNTTSETLLRKIINLYFGSHNYERALRFLDSLTYTYRNDPEILYKKAQVLIKLHRLEEALEVMQQIKDYYADDATYWFTKGFILNVLGRNEEAQIAIDKGLSIEEKKPKLWYYKALFFASMRDKAQTLENLRMAFSVAPYLKDEAREEELFDFIRQDKEFRDLLV